jgi:hypothetical protein
LLKCMAPSSRGSSGESILSTAGRFLPSCFPLSKTPANGGLIVNQIQICGPWDTWECCDFSPALVLISTKPQKATVHYKGTGSVPDHPHCRTFQTTPWSEKFEGSDEKRVDNAPWVHSRTKRRVHPERHGGEGATNKPREYSPIRN